MKGAGLLCKSSFLKESVAQLRKGRPHPALALLVPPSPRSGRDLDIRNEENPGDSSLRARNDRVGPVRSFSYGVVSSFTLQEMAPFGPGAWVHVHGHSLISETGGPFNLSARNFPLPVGAPTRSVAPMKRNDKT